MADYLLGHVKRNPATNAVAVRTQFPDDEHFGHMAWLIATPNVGAKNAHTSDVESWDDLHTNQ